MRAWVVVAALLVSGLAVAAAPECKLPGDLTSIRPRASDATKLAPLCRAGREKVDEMLALAVGWYRAAPGSLEARDWLSQALYSRALRGDHLRLPCEPEPVYIDSGPPRGETAAAAMVRHGREKAQLGWDHLLTSAASKADAEAALCFADAAVGADAAFAYARALRILIDLARDSELRDRVRASAARPGPFLESFYVEYVVDYLGLQREQEAAELLLVIRERVGAMPAVETARAAIVLQVSSAPDAPGRAEKQAWLAAHGFNESWRKPMVRVRRSVGR
jgi:hypothetical protein